MDLQAIHAETLRGTARVVDGVRPDQLEKPTPCTEWDVRALINHMVGVNAMFARAGRGEPPAEGDPGDLLGDDPAGAYRRSMEEALEALHRPGVLEEAATPTEADCKLAREIPAMGGKRAQVCDQTSKVPPARQ